MLIRILGGTFLLGAVFTGAFYAGKFRILQEPSAISTYKPCPYPIVNRAFVIVVVAHNNGATLEKTLSSAFSQNYSDYRIIYIDDASDDSSFDLASDLIYKSGQMIRTTLVQNESRLGVLENISRAVEVCEDKEIVVLLNGGDWLAHEWVLSKLNQYYANPELWMTYGQYREYPEYSMGRSRPPADLAKPARQQPFFASHLKTFYASLFKQISLTDLTELGTFYPAATDLAYMLPILEMAGSHAGFIADVLYIANRSASVEENVELSIHCEKSIRSMAAYEPLKKRDCR